MMTHSQPTIALMTDFGLSDTYVGVMKGVIRTICPAAEIIDLTHHIAPQNIAQAAYALLTAYAYMPPQTVFVVVVDPGVGSVRHPIAVQLGDYTFVAPDNGVLSYISQHIAPTSAVVLDNSAYHLQGISNTFHGRDIFSPVGAHLAQGVPLADVGSPHINLVSLPQPRLHITDHTIEGEVIYIDHFGNVITSIGQLYWMGANRLRFNPLFATSGDSAPAEIDVAQCRVQIADYRFDSIAPSYAAVPVGHSLALINSAGQLEIGVNQGHAATQLGLGVGAKIVLNLA